MSKGRGKIEPKDNPKPFQKGNKAAETWTEDIALQLGNELIEWLNEVDVDNQDKENIFFEEFLVIKKNLHPSTIAYLSNKFLTFLNLIEKAKKIQEIKLVKYGVADRLNATMTKFVLANHHGYSERIKETIQTTSQILSNDPLDADSDDNGTSED